MRIKLYFYNPEYFLLHFHQSAAPASIFYYRIQDPIVKKEETKAEVEQSILKELKLDGLINADENVVEHLERNLSGTSTFYPLRMNKNKTLGSASKALSKENFDTVLAYTKEKEKELKIRSTSTAVFPEPAAADTRMLRSRKSITFCCSSVHFTLILLPPLSLPKYQDALS